MSASAPWPAVPGNNATIVMFATHRRQAGGSGAWYEPPPSIRSPADIKAVTITWLRHNKASAANGLRVYGIDDTGAYQETDLQTDAGASTIGTASPVQIPVLAAGREHRETLIVSHLRNGFAIEYTAGPDNPEEWNGVIAIDYNNQVITR